jgi:hypothetical protein
MKIIGWLILAASGVGVSIWSYRSDRPAEGFAPISSGLIVVAKSSQQRIEDPASFPSTRASVMQLPVSGIAALFGMSVGGDKENGRSLRFQLSEKLILVPLKEADINESSLAWGKLPRVGRNEVLAGEQAAHQQQFQANETTYFVTGGLRREVGLFGRSYVVPARDRTEEHSDEEDPSFRSAMLIPLSIEQLANKQAEEQLKGRFPPEQFDRMTCLPVTAPRDFYVSLFGEALLLLGGSGALIALYTMAALRVGGGVLRDPLVALSTHRRLLWSVHLVYFGLYLVAAVLAYRTPDVRNAVQAIIQGNLRGGGGLLEFAGKAYLSGNIFWAATVTFVINFLVGSIVFLTLPSCVIPGSGALMAAFRAVSWGLLLAPATVQQALVMLPHSGTLLLEGEGYILATFFGLMLAVYLFRPKGEPGAPSPYVRGLVLNLKGSLLVALVLGAAAVYEAVEVILMLRSSGGI